VTVSGTSENDTSDSGTSGYDGIVDTDQTLPQVVVTAYHGYFHNQLVKDMAAWMNSTGSRDLDPEFRTVWTWTKVASEVLHDGSGS
jgi:hypothetical protein